MYISIYIIFFFFFVGGAVYVSTVLFGKFRAAERVHLF